MMELGPLNLSRKVTPIREKILTNKFCLVLSVSAPTFILLWKNFHHSNQTRPKQGATKLLRRGGCFAFSQRHHWRGSIFSACGGCVSWSSRGLLKIQPSSWALRKYGPSMSSGRQRKGKPNRGLKPSRKLGPKVSQLVACLPEEEIANATQVNK